MGIKFKMGDAVRQVMPAPMAGPVVEAIIVDSDVQYRIECTDADGNVTSKWFTEDQIEAVEAQP